MVSSAWLRGVTESAGIEAFADAGDLGELVAGQHLEGQLVQAAGLGGAAVGEQGHRIVAHERGPDCGLHAEVRDHPADDQFGDVQAAQQRLERGPLEGVEADLVHHQVPGTAAELVHHIGIPGTGGQPVEARQGGTVPDQRAALVGAARPVQVAGEDHRDRGPAGLGDRDGGVAHGVLRAVQAHADPAERAIRVAEAILHVHHQQRPVRHCAHLRRYVR